MGNDAVLWELEDGVATVTLNQPNSLNALSAEMARGLGAALAMAAADPAVRVVLLAGAGRAFCAGGDLKAIAQGFDAQDGRRYMEGLQPLVRQIVTLDKPVLAAVNGHAVGAGFSLALACDLVVAGEGARFAEAFKNVGLAPDLGNLYFLARSVGLHRARELVFSGRNIDAREARTLGLVNRVVPDAELLPEARAWALELAAGPTATFGQVKRLLRRSFDVSLEQYLELEARAQAELFGTADHKEGVRAFLEKRVPKFAGR